MKKRGALICLIFCILICLIVISKQPASAAVPDGYGYCGTNDLMWSFSKEYRLLVIFNDVSSKMNDYSETNRPPWYQYKSYIDTVHISSCENVGISAFADMNISEVIFESKQYCSLLTIDTSAFAGCKKLTQITIPDTVQTIGGFAFLNCTNLKTVNLPGNLTKITEYTFYGCSSLTGLVVPKSVTNIGTSAFKSVTNPIVYAGSETEWQQISGYNTCGSTNVAYCKGMCGENVTYEFVPSTGLLTLSGSGPMDNLLPNGYTQWSLRGFRALVKRVDIKGNVTSIGDYTFYYLTNCDDFRITAPITYIGECAFELCTGMTKFSVPSTVTIIESRAFSSCPNLKEISLPSSLIRLGTNSISSGDNSQLKTTYAGSSYGWQHLDGHGSCGAKNVTCLGKDVTGVTLNKSKTTIGTYSIENLYATVAPSDAANKTISRWTSSNESVATVFGNNNVGVVWALSPGTTVITAYTQENEKTASCEVTVSNFVWGFDSATGTLTVNGAGEMPNYENSSQQPWHSYASSITNVKMGSFSSIGDYAFADLTQVTKYSLSSSVTSYGDYAFLNNSSLQSFTMLNTVKSVGKGAFQNGSSLKSITFSNTLNSIGENAFFGCKLVDVSIPDSVTYIGGAAFRCNEWTLKTIKFPKSMKTINEAVCQECYTLSSIIFPEDLEVISNNAFLFARLYDGLTLPDTLKYIGDHAFRYSYGLTELTIPAGVTHIGETAFRKAGDGSSSGFKLTILADGDVDYTNAFCECTKLTEVTLKEGLTSISKGIFSACPNLKTINIPSTVQSIGESAFNNCSSLTGLTLPHSVTSLGANAFNGVTNAITYVGSSWELTHMAGYSDCGTVNFVCIGTAVSGVTLNKTRTTILLGQTETLTAAVIPNDATNQTIAWETSDASVATVSSGVVTAVGSGTATITVTTGDGAKTAACKVTVCETVSDFLSSNGLTITGEHFYQDRSFTATATPKGIGYALFFGYTDGEVLEPTAAVCLTVPCSEDIVSTDVPVMCYAGEETAVHIEFSYNEKNNCFEIPLNRLNGTLYFRKQVKIPTNCDCTYDGQSHYTVDVEGDWSIYSASGHTSAVPGSGTAEVCFKDTSLYRYEWEDGTQEKKTISWTVQKRPYTIRANDVTADYDGKVHGANSSGAYCADGTELASGHTLSGVTVSGSASDCGTYTNLLTPSGAVITDGSGKDVTAYYDITYTPGTLTIIPVFDSEPGYLWNGNQCTATLVCYGAPELTKTETVTGVYVKDRDATCTAAEAGHYSAVFQNEVFASQVTAQNSVIVGDPLGHGAWTYSADEAVLTASCGHNSCTHTETAAIVLSADTFTYDGEAKTPATVTCSDGFPVKTLTVNYQSNTNAGNAAASIAFEGATASAYFTIEKAAQSITAEVNQSFIFGDTDKSVAAAVAVGDGSLCYAVKSGSSVAVASDGKLTILSAGETVVTVTALETANYKSAAVDITVTVLPKPLVKPCFPQQNDADRIYTYLGEVQTFLPDGFDSATMTITGNVQTNANETGYSVTVAPKENYTWNTDGNCSFVWIIRKGEVGAAYKTASGEITTPENSTVSITLPAPPAGASFETPDFSEWDNVTGTISNGKLNILATAVLTEGEKTVTVPVNGGTNYNSYSVTVSVSVIHAHTYGEAQYLWDGAQCTAVRICSQNSSHKETETVTGVYVKDRDATCTAAEAGHYSAVFQNEVFASQVTAQNSVIVGDPLGHGAWTYSADEAVLTASCGHNSCTHTETAAIVLSADTFTYDGEAKTPATVTYSDGFPVKTLTVNYRNNVNAGSAEAAATLDEETAKVSFTIEKAIIEKPTFPRQNDADRIYTYLGEVQTFLPDGFDPATMTITGNIQTNANEAGYSVTVAPGENYAWSTDGDCSFVWKIAKAGVEDALKTASGILDHAVGSNVGIDLPKPPADAAYGAVGRGSMSGLSAVISSGTLLLTVTDDDIPLGTKEIIVTIPVTGAANYEDYSITVSVEIVYRLVQMETPTLDSGTVTLQITAVVTEPTVTHFVVACYDADGRVLGISMATQTVDGNTTTVTIDYPEGIKESDVARWQVVVVDANGLYPMGKAMEG